MTDAENQVIYYKCYDSDDDTFQQLDRQLCGYLAAGREGQGRGAIQ